VLDSAQEGDSRVTVTVTAPAAEATTGADVGAAAAGDTISLVDAGYSVRDHKHVGIGVLLHNDSDRTARSVVVQVNVLDAGDDILVTDTSTLAVIPAGVTVAYGSDVFLPEAGEPVKLEVTTTPGSFANATVVLPTIRRIRLVNEAFLGLAVTGEVRNTTSQQVDALQRINVVLLDREGKVSGGGYSFLDAALAPGGRAAFRASNGVSVTPPGGAENAIVTIDQRPF
jgi:hypothetical protein